MTNGAHSEHVFIKAAEDAGIAETFCSYHKVVIGAALSGVLPKPEAIVNTSLTCDANNLTFRKVAEIFDVPRYYIDVPWHTDEEAIRYVADQLREMARFVEDILFRMNCCGRESVVQTAPSVICAAAFPCVKIILFHRK